MLKNHFMKNALLPIILITLSLSLSAQIDLQLDLISNAFTSVVDITNAGDDRLFVVEKAGRIRILQADGNINATPFLDIDALISSSGERGLLGLAFHPDYANNGYFFVNYTNNSGHTVVARYQVSSGDPDVADTGSATILLTINQPFSNHNGGDLAFGPDGYLYICSGDGGDGGDPQDNGQETATLLGKIIRIDVDNGPGTAPDYAMGQNYTVPASNPLADGPGGTLDEIWALGLRNPWRFSFDRLTGDMWIGDVGQGLWEEIDFEPAGSPGGLNYGWRCYEGNQTYNTTDCGPASEYTFPVHDYDHNDGSCSVTGGFVYRGADFPLLYGLYLYTDYCSGRIWSLENVDGSWVNEELFQDATGQFVTMGEDYRGELYIGNQSGELYQIREISCARELTVDDNAIPEDTYSANETLISSGTVESGTSVTFTAGELVRLAPGFHAEADSEFLAQISACAPETNALVAEIPGPAERLQAIPVSNLKLFPNPVRSETTIQYQLPVASEVEIMIWNIHGQLMARPLPAQVQEAGIYQLPFRTQALPAGVYMTVLRTGAAQEVLRMEIIR